MTTTVYNRIRAIVSLVMMALMLIFPAKLYVIKIVLLGILFFTFIGKTRISKTIRFLLLFLVMSTLWGLIVGTLNGNPYPLAGVTTGVMWPILGVIIVLPQLTKEIDFNNLAHYLFYLHAFIVIYDILFALHFIIGFPFFNLYPEVETPFSYYGTTSRLNLDDNLNVLTFTIPFYFLIWLSNYNIRINRIFQLFMIAAAFFLMILSGRRSLMLIFITAPILVVLTGEFLPKESVKTVRKMLVFFVVLLFFALLYVSVNEPELLEGYSHTFLKAFDSDEESTKFIQAKMLWNNFCENPIIGAGNGAEFYEAARGVRQHQYELIYLLILATRGIIGGCMYFWGIFGVLIIGVRLFLKTHDIMLLSLMFGFLFVLIANATNPVLSSFDLMLPLYFCYAKINSLSLKRTTYYINNEDKIQYSIRSSRI